MIKEDDNRGPFPWDVLTVVAIGVTSHLIWLYNQFELHNPNLDVFGWFVWTTIVAGILRGLYLLRYSPQGEDTIDNEGLSQEQEEIT